MTLGRRSLAAAASLVLAAPAAARAQGFPDRPVRYVVPFPPGGLTDIMARLVAQRLQEHWSRPVVVENRAGGNAMIGADAVAKSPPDGHTLLAVTLAHAVNVTLFPNAPYDFLRDLAPVAALGSLPLVVCVNAANPARSLADLAAQARARPLNAGSSGNGTPPHLGLELFRQVSGAGANITHVPYRGGAPSLTDLLGGSLDLIVSNLPECLPHLQAGRLRGLAVTGEARHRLVPDIPTAAEAGAPALVLSNWTGVVAPSGTPGPVLAEVERATLLALRHPDLRHRAEEGGFDLLGWDRGRTRGFFAAEVERWGRLVREANIRPDA